MSGAYFWDGSKVSYIDGWVDHDRRKAVIGLPCVDTTEDTAAQRYGVFGTNGWQSRPLDQLPKEFRMHLLLLGVS